MNMKNYTATQKLTLSALCMSLYLVVMLCTQSFAFGQYQVRIATALYGLSAIFPFLIVPFGLVNMVSNAVMGGLGPLDMLGGTAVGILTTALIVFGKKRGWGNWIILVSTTFIPGLGVPLWLSYLLQVPYLVLVSTVIVGQAISGVAGMLLVNALERSDLQDFVLSKK
jgi:uncharacterized membrane protein